MAAEPEAGPSSPAALVATSAGIATALLAAAWLAAQVPAVAAGEVLRFGAAWLPALGVELAFRIDGLSLLFGLLISGIGALVLLYAHHYIAGHSHAARLQLYLVLFMLSMLGVVLADDAVLLFVFWELTTVTSYLLIGFQHGDPTSRRSALQALLVTGTGGLALLAGLLLVGGIEGTLRISDWSTDGALLAHALYPGILVLVLLGAFTKSAQFPFHFWLPNAMAAPTPVSAYLHSATMVKAGVYLLARLAPVLGGSDAWLLALATAGGFTAAWAAWISLRQTDLKLALAYTTVVSLGLLVLMLAPGTPGAVAAAVTFLLVHALYKCALFLVVGIVDHETGTRDVALLGGLGRAMPWTAGAAALAALSMAGIPPLLGFVGKELQYEMALGYGPAPGVVTAVLVGVNALMFAIAGVVALRPFWGAPTDVVEEAEEAPAAMLAGPLLLAGLGLACGVFSGAVGELLIAPAVSAIRAEPAALHLSLWHGFNAALALSGVTTLLGVALYLFREPLRAVFARALARLPLTGDRGYDGALDGLKALARWQTDLLQGGSLRRYLTFTFGTLALAVGGTLLLRDGLAWPGRLAPVPPHAWVIAGLIAAGSSVPLLVQSRLAVITALGVAGIGISLLFLLFGAPDVAMTQLLVETLFVVIVAVVLLRLPPLFGKDHPRRRGRAFDAVVAVATGATVSAVLLATISGPLDLGISQWFAAESLPSAHGRNIVNVILVDFRALDTMGEITVVAVAGWAAYALLKLRPSSEEAP
jgi:multicomponent Na+:H+ antiporter subunit A